MRPYDLAVIGGGSGGIRAATVAARHGARVLLAEASRVGGTCVIRGCVPKKLMVVASRFAAESRDRGRLGWGPGDSPLPWEVLAREVAREVARLEGVYRASLESSGVEIVHATARVGAGVGEVVFDDGRTVSADRVLVAAGARPARDDGLPGAGSCSVSDDVFGWPARPQRLVVAGAGYIALELGSLFLRLGSEVTVLARGQRILQEFDVDVREAVQAALADRGMTFAFGRRISGVEGRSGDLVVRTAAGDRLPADAVLLATGRVPDTARLGLEQHGVRMSPAGAVVVDGRFRSSVPWIFAVGDAACGHRQSTPHAVRDGQRFAEFEFTSGPSGEYPPLQPYALFTTPEAGGAGLTEDEAIRNGRPVDVHIRSFRPLREALLEQPDRCVFKTLVDRATDRIVGIHLVGSEAAEIAQVYALAMAAGVSRGHLDRTLAIHPTIAEELLHLGSPVRRLG